MPEANPWDEELSDQETGADDGTGDVSKNFTDLRKYAKRMERERNTFEKELLELREFKASFEKQERDKAITAAFQEVGLNPKHAELFSKLNEGEVTVEAVQSFAAEYELPTVQGQNVEAPPEKSVGFNPVSTGSPAPLAKLTTEDIDKMLREGQVEAVERAYKEGRVEKEVAPW